MSNDIINASRYPEFRQQLEASALAIHTIAETIREQGEIPSGELRSRLTGKVELRDFDLIIDTPQTGRFGDGKPRPSFEMESP